MGYRAWAWRPEPSLLDGWLAFHAEAGVCTVATGVGNGFNLKNAKSSTSFRHEPSPGSMRTVRRKPRAPRSCTVMTQRVIPSPGPAALRRSCPAPAPPTNHPSRRGQMRKCDPRPTQPHCHCSSCTPPQPSLLHFVERQRGRRARCAAPALTAPRAPARATPPTPRRREGGEGCERSACTCCGPGRRAPRADAIERWTRTPQASTCTDGSGSVPPGPSPTGPERRHSFPRKRCAPDG